MRTVTIASASASIALVVCAIALPGEPTHAQDSTNASPAAGPSSCREQTPQEFLVRKNTLVNWRDPPEVRATRRNTYARSLQYRTEQYGYVRGFGKAASNPHPPGHSAKRIQFMGKPVRVHEKIVPALACVEAEIRATCSDVPYQPRRLSGLRERNTYHTGEVSNHVYGIAIDIDPALNTCCGCIAPWRDHALCKRAVQSIFERMAMPECWVHAFEKYGFYWLGHDTLQDTMHFEFLGDPDRIRL